MLEYCFYCGQQLDEITPDELPVQQRVAFDAQLGRLWVVCPDCQRWNPYPLDARWEMLEQCERWAHDSGEMLLETPHLALLAVDDAQLIRVGTPPRIDFADWRYSSRLDAFVIERKSLFERALLALPERPVDGYTFQGQPARLDPIWAGSAFVEHGALLSQVFSEVPLADTCPACGDPLVLHPAHFGNIQIVPGAGGLAARTICELCGVHSDVELTAARAALRVGLAIVNHRHRKPKDIASAARQVDEQGAALAYLESIARLQLNLGGMTARERMALWMSLDDWAEADALEAEWKEAEEVAAISDGELTNVKGFEEFRARVRSGPAGA